MQNLIVHNPLEEDFPSDPVDRIHRLARDLAWGALNKLWAARVEIRGSIIAPPRTLQTSMLKDYLSSWGSALPGAYLLTAFGYLEEKAAQSPSGQRINVGDITLAAFALLKQPTRTPRVYVSYHPDYSSALALLVVARLQLVGVSNPSITLETNPGDALHAEREPIMRQSDYLICLLAPGTLSSPYVLAELEWALSSEDAAVIPMWHAGFSPAHDYPQALATRNAIRVEDTSAAAYNGAVVRLLNRLGYPP